MKQMFTLALAAVLALGLTASASAADVVLKFSNVTSQSAIDAGKVFKKVAEEASGGSLQINLFDNNQLGDDRVVIEGTIFGDIDIAVSSTSPMATIFPDFYLFDAPYLFLSTPGAYAGLDSATGKKILADMEPKGLRGLGFWENGFRNFTNNKVAVKVPADAAGMKIRTMENEIHLAAWKALGTNPTPMAFTELFTAMQQGTVDGQENPLGIIDGNKFQEVQEYLSMTQHVYTPYILCMNAEKYASLSDAHKAAIDKAAAESTEYQRNRSQELEKEIKVRFASTGVVIDLTDAEKKAWQDVIVKAKIFDLVKEKMANPAYLDEMLK